MGCALLGGVLIGLLNAFLILICRIRPSSPPSARFIASSAERIYTDGGGAIAYRRMAPSITTGGG